MDKRTAPATSKGRRGPHMATRAKETLKSCGPLTLEQFAEGLGIDMKTARTLAKNGIQKGHWKREQHADGEKLVLVTVAPSAASARGASGLKRHLAKQAGQPVEQSVRPTRQSAPALPAADQPVPAAQFGLFNTGEFRIEYLGQEMKLPRHITREMVAYLDKIASAFEE